MTSPFAADPAVSDAVFTAMADAAEREIMPRWRALAEDEIRTKSAEWDLVTDADVNAELLITAALRELSDAPVVGEEATADDASLLDIVGAADACWVVDPVDGTRNFVHGKESFACMVAYIVGGRTEAAWITYPAVGRSISAVLGQGTVLDGERLVRAQPNEASALRGAIGASFVANGEDLMARANSLGPADAIRMCAGWDYLDVVTGLTDYVSFSRTLPWDHAPGALIAQEAGLRSARPDGSEYLPGDGGAGILTAHPSVWERVTATLFTSPHAPSGA